MTTFANVSDLFKKAVNKKLYVKLSNGYFAPISKKDINHISKNMAANDIKFCGNIIDGSDWFIQIELI
jgi:hypothetical protein